MDRSDILKLAAEASCTDRTVRAYLAGRTMKPATIERIERAAQRLGLKMRRAPNAKTSRGG